jgi:hypothetical protein
MIVQRRRKAICSPVSRCWRVMCIAVVVVTSSSLLASCDWTMPGFNPARTGFNPGEHTITLANLDTLDERWKSTPLGASAATSSPTIARGIAYVTTTDGYIFAFDATGQSGCSGTPATCAPLWTANLGFVLLDSPTVVGGVLYVAGRHRDLYAFDAAGKSGCSGTPTTCTPLWTGSLEGSLSSPVVVNGVAYVTTIFSIYPYSYGKVAAFDAAGVAGCSGQPKTCQPLWTSMFPNYFGDPPAPAVANGVVYVEGSDFSGQTQVPLARLYAYDAAGVTGCSGQPKVCTPLWSAGSPPPSQYAWAADPVVHGSQVYFGYGPDPYATEGTTGCPLGLPFCVLPLWRDDAGPSDSHYQGSSGVAIAHGLMYASVVETSSANVGGVNVFDEAGIAGCSDVSGFKTCSPLWRATVDSYVFVPAVIASDVMYVLSTSEHLFAFDANGDTSCGGAPKTCTAVWSRPARSQPAIVNGVLYYIGTDDRLHAEAPSS